MPRKDPMTGCTVMTTGEFWAKEAEAEGKGREPWELMNDFWQELEADSERCRQQMLKPAYAFETIRREMIEINGCVAEEDQYRFDLVRVVRVIDADMSQNLRSSSEGFTAVVDTTDGRKLCHFWSSHSSGSYWEPPDYDSELTFDDMLFDGESEDNEARLLWLILPLLPLIGLILGLL